MQKVNRPQAKWWNLVLLLIGLLVIFADQVSKVWIRANLLRGQELFDTGFFQIIHAQNTGAAFGIFQNQSLALTIVAFIGIIVILLCAFLFYRHWPFIGSMLAKSALGLILGGTVGNLIDRLRRGYVTDFIDFKVWPAFNVADAAVTIGVIIFVCYILYLAIIEKHSDEQDI